MRGPNEESLVRCSQWVLIGYCSNLIMEKGSGADKETENCDIPCSEGGRTEDSTLEAEAADESSENLSNCKDDEPSNCKEDENSPGSDLDYSVWDYTPDKSVELDYNMDPSQPCFNIRGVSYTPPGWKRKYSKRSNSPSDQEEVCAKKKLKFE